jgi:hypothetical protein
MNAVESTSKTRYRRVQVLFRIRNLLISDEERLEHSPYDETILCVVEIPGVPNTVEP